MDSNLSYKEQADGHNKRLCTIAYLLCIWSGRSGHSLAQARGSSAIDANGLNQAVKAVALAAVRLREKGINVGFVPEFVNCGALTLKFTDGSEYGASFKFSK